METKKFDLYDAKSKAVVPVEAKKAGKEGEWIALCPEHHDTKPSLCINTEKGVYGCKGCDFKGQLNREVEATYTYTDEAGNPLFQVVKSRRGDARDYYARRPDGHGGWINNLTGVTLVLYRLPELLEGEDPVFIVEGEKDVETLRALGLTSTTNPLGAGKWRTEYNDPLIGRDVVILPDNDVAGRQHAETVENTLYGIAKSIKVVNLPGLQEKGDVTYWLNAGNTKEKLFSLVESAPGPKEIPVEVLFDSQTSSGDFMIGEAWKIQKGNQVEDWLWEGIIPGRGISMILGKPKLGKSTFALNLADCITYGRPFLNRKVKKGKIIYMVLEGESLIDQTLRGWTLSDDFLQWRYPLAFDYKKKIEILKGWTSSHKPVAVFIDNLQRFSQIAKIESYSEMSNALQPIEDIARVSGCHIILTHHSKKMEGDIRDAFLGSTAGMGSVEAGILIKGYPEKAHPYKYRTFSTVQRCHLPGGEDIEGEVLDMDSDYRLSSGGLQGELRQENLQQQIIEVLKTSEMKADDVIKTLSVSRTEFYKALRALKKAGIVETIGTGRKGSPARLRVK